MRVFTPSDKDSRNIRVWLNFKEVTNECYYAECADKSNRFHRGAVGLYAKDENGKFIDESDGFGRREIKRIEKRGLTFWRWN